MDREGATAPGRRSWAIAEGYIPSWSHGPAPEMLSHETLCILNAGAQDAEIEARLYFADREPAGPYRLAVPARRTRHFRIGELEGPEPVPEGTDFSCVLVSNVPVIVQHTRLDSRQTANALMTTIAFPID
jgi:hypothetical protein